MTAKKKRKMFRQGRNELILAAVALGGPALLENDSTQDQIDSELMASLGPDDLQDCDWDEFDLP